LPFWYRMTRVVPEKGPLNGCVCVCVRLLWVVCLFAEVIVETGRSVDNVVHHELLVYFLGTLKFLSGNSTVVKTLAGKHYLTSLSRILTSINSTVSACRWSRLFEYDLICCY